jgi:hypothetical protein
MSAAVAAASDYKQLIAEFPPKVIRSEEENRFYLDKLTEMTYRWDALTPQERDLYRGYEAKRPGWNFPNGKRCI